MVSARSAAAEPAVQDRRGSSRHVLAASAPGGGAASGQSRDLDPSPAPAGRALGRELVLGHSSARLGVGRLAGVRPESRAEGGIEGSGRPLPLWGSQGAEGPVPSPGYGALWPGPGRQTLSPHAAWVRMNEGGHTRPWWGATAEWARPARTSGMKLSGEEEEIVNLRPRERGLPLNPARGETALESHPHHGSTHLKA